jgi:hypothetical protein
VARDYAQSRVSRITGARQQPYLFVTAGRTRTATLSFKPRNGHGETRIRIG